MKRKSMNELLAILLILGGSLLVLPGCNNDIDLKINGEEVPPSGAPDFNFLVRNMTQGDTLPANQKAPFELYLKQHTYTKPDLKYTLGYTLQDPNDGELVVGDAVLRSGDKTTIRYSDLTDNKMVVVFQPYRSKGLISLTFTCSDPDGKSKQVSRSIVVR